MRSRIVVFVIALTLPTQGYSVKKTHYETIEKKSIMVHNLRQILRPFVADCTRKKTRSKRLFCEALNNRLKAQHQAKIYRVTRKPSSAGPLTVIFEARPKPVMEIRVRGCLTCEEPMLARRGGDISKGRFFLFKMPKEIKIRRSKVLYDLGNIDVTAVRVPLPEGTTAEKFKKEILPHLRLDFIFRPVAGVTMIGHRHKYGVINFELTAHRVYNKCTAEVYSMAPKMARKYVVDKNDLSCPQNQTPKAVTKPQLPPTIPRKKVKALMELVSNDLFACYEQYGKDGNIPTDIVVSPNGKVKSVKVVGKLAGTPSSKCVERLVRAVSFPKFSGSDARLQWPFTLSR